MIRKLLGMTAIGAAMAAAAAVGAALATEMTSRAGWRAGPAITERMTPHEPRAIIIHHTGVRQNPRYTLDQKMRGLQSFSQGDRLWGDVPYHFYIDMAGDVAEGRHVAFAGDTNTRYDTRGYIQIVLEGHFDEERPSQAQLAALQTLVAYVRSTYGVPTEAISGHMDHAATDCPGRHLYPHVATLRAGRPIVSGG